MKTIIGYGLPDRAAFASPAQAKGCIKGAIVGGVAGHMAAHGKLGRRPDASSEITRQQAEPKQFEGSGSLGPEVAREKGRAVKIRSHSESHIVELHDGSRVPATLI